MKTNHSLASPFLLLVMLLGTTSIVHAQPGTVKAYQKISAVEGGFTGMLADGDRFGNSIALLGDLDGDGVGDIAVGAPQDDDGGNSRGAVWILFLNADATVKSHQKISDTQGGFVGILDDTDDFGLSISSLGDLDGDGIGDLAVGALQADDGGAQRGAVWILFLNVNGTVKSHQKISDTSGGFGGGLSNSDEFGVSIARLGDLDGDGVLDIAVGAHGDDDGGGNRGAVWILFLNSDGTVKAHQKISATSGGFVGPLSNSDLFGNTLAPLGDHDGDGIFDLAVGGALDDDGGLNRGAIWMLFLNSDGTVKSEVKISDTQGSFTGGLSDGDVFGPADGLGDLDGDGIRDLAAGASTDDDGGTNRGSIWILLLNLDGTVKSHQKISSTTGGFAGSLDDGDVFGTRAGVLNDFDGDGVTDLAVGATGDDDGGFDRGAVWVLFLNGDPVNVPPTADAGGPYNGNEGADIALSSATALDLDGDPLTLSWSVDTSPTSVTCTFSDASILNPSLSCDDDGTFTATLTVDDGTATPVTADATVNVANVDPTVGAVTVPTDPLNINEQLITGVSADFSDPGANDTHTCTIDYDDGTGSQVGTINGATCEGPDHTYAESGVYEVTVEVTDDDLGSGNATATSFIVIYDPAEGFVTGGGWIDSPAGACPVFCNDAMGTANFGFVSKYKKGASVPTGQTEFNFTAGDLNFHSTSYNWLVIAGAKAMYKGDGTVNGDAGFTFQVNAIDGSLPGGGDVDKFRIKIKESGGGVIYDNQMGASDNDDPSTALGGGQIKIHKKGNGNGNNNKAVLDDEPDVFAFYGSYPNPFNPATTLGYNVPESAHVSLVVFDAAGREVIRLLDGAKEPGRYEVIFDATALPSGIYFARFKAGDGFAQTQRLTLMK